MPDRINGLAANASDLRRNWGMWAGTELSKRIVRGVENRSLILLVLDVKLSVV